MSRRPHRYVLRVLIALDQLVNALLGGDEDETVSSRAARARAAGAWWGLTLCRFLDWLEPDHCKNAIGE